MQQLNIPKSWISGGSEARAREPFASSRYAIEQRAIKQSAGRVERRIARSTRRIERLTRRHNRTKNSLKKWMLGHDISFEKEYREAAQSIRQMQRELGN